MDKRKESNKIVRESICEALIRLMEKKDYDKITVTDITTKAGVARASYYRNFNSKEDVLRAYISSLIGEFYDSRSRELGEMDDYESILQICIHLDRYRDTFALLIRVGLSELLLNALSSLSNYPFGGEQNPEDAYYFVAFVGAMFNVTRQWLTSPRGESPEEMATIFYDVWHRQRFRQAAMTNADAAGEEKNG